MGVLNLREATECRFDILALGEVMLRLDPGEGRVRNTRHFAVWEGGGEYNVARGMRRCFGQRAALASAFAQNDVGMLLEDLILQGGVDTSLIKWIPFDGIGRTVRNGLNFTERGFGVRGAIGVSDRANTAASQIKSGDFDWDDIFGNKGVRWLHTGGIFAALSETTGQVTLDAIRSAKKHGAVVSFDLNYRPSLWKDIGGNAGCKALNREIAPHVDVMIGSLYDFADRLCADTKMPASGSLIDDYQNIIAETVSEFPNLKAVATTLRGVQSATVNDWQGMCWYDGAFYTSVARELEILDRVGGGDGFASGFIYGMMTFGDAQKAVDYGAAHGALAMTTPGDNSMASLAEVENLVSGGGAHVDR